MTFFPAIIVLAIVFLSFSRKVLITPEESRDRMGTSFRGSDPRLANPRGPEALMANPGGGGSDALRKYELLRSLERGS